MMMNRAMQLNHSVALSAFCASAAAFFVFHAVRFFGALRFYFYYFFGCLLSPESQLVS